MDKTIDKKQESVPSYCQVLKFKDSNGQVKEMIFPKALDLDRPKRPRTTFSESQLASLENEFQRNPYLIGKDRTRLAADLGLTETQVKVWFQNRRTKSKRSKTGDHPNSPSPPSQADPQSICEERPPFMQKPTFENPKIESLDPKRGFSMDQLGNTSPTSMGTKPVPFPVCQPSQPLSMDFSPFGQLAPQFAEYMPIRQPNLAGPPGPFFGQLGNGQGQNGSWSGPALWFPWSNHLAPCIQVKNASNE